MKTSDMDEQRWLMGLTTSRAGRVRTERELAEGRQPQKGQLQALASKHGGKISSGQTWKFDGENYSYKSVWDSDEDIDSFIDALADKGIEIKADRDIVNGILTLYFNT